MQAGWDTASIDDRADYLVALAAIERGERRLSAAEVRRALGL